MLFRSDRDRNDQVLQTFHKLAFFRTSAERAVYRRTCKANRTLNDGAACSGYGQKVRCYKEADVNHRLRPDFVTTCPQGQNTQRRLIQGHINRKAIQRSRSQGSLRQTCSEACARYGKPRKLDIFYFCDR